MKKPELSIIIPSYNTKVLLQKCLESIVQSVAGIKESEIIVVDNGSRDGTAEYLKTQNSKLKTETKNLKLKIVLNKINLGFSRAVNQGLRIAQSEAILLLNSDTQVKPVALEKLLEFERKVRPAIIGLRMLNPDGTIQGSVFNLPTIKKAVEEFWLGRKNVFSKYVPVGSRPVKVEAVSGGAMALSREVLEKVGDFDERYFFYFEDLDYCRRAKKAGFTIFYLPRAEVIHKHGASGKDLVANEVQWKRLVPSSKIYFGTIRHYLINFILWSGQKLRVQS